MSLLVVFCSGQGGKGGALPGVEWGGRGKWELQIRGTSYGPTPGLGSLETVETEAILAMVIG